MPAYPFPLTASPPSPIRRNLGGDDTSIANEVTSANSPTSSPFFQPSSNGNNVGSGSNLTKTALEWVFALAALLVVGGLAFLRYTRRRQALVRHVRDQSPSSVNGTRRHPRTTGLPFDNDRRFSSGPPAPLPMSAALFYPPAMTRIPRASLISNLSSSQSQHPPRGRRAAHGVDIDGQGRRGGERDLDDREMYGGDDKDFLPAYETVGSPPKYGSHEPAMPLTSLPTLPLHDDSDIFLRASSSTEGALEPSTPASPTHDEPVQFPHADAPPPPPPEEAHGATSRPPLGGGEPAP